MANEQIVADAKKLRSISGSIGTVHTNLRNNFQDASAQVDKLKNIWTGDSASQFYNNYQKLLNECSLGLDTIGRMTNALYNTADSYERQIQDVQKAAADLPKLPKNTML